MVYGKSNDALTQIDVAMAVATVDKSYTADGNTFHFQAGGKEGHLGSGISAGRSGETQTQSESLPIRAGGRWTSKRGAFKCKQIFRRSSCSRRSTMLESKKKSHFNSNTRVHQQS
jgi:hypothetical protein